MISGKDLPQELLEEFQRNKMLQAIDTYSVNQSPNPADRFKIVLEGKESILQ
jgi:hypothetical protein